MKNIGIVLAILLCTSAVNAAEWAEFAPWPGDERVGAVEIRNWARDMPGAPIWVAEVPATGAAAAAPTQTVLPAQLGTAAPAPIPDAPVWLVGTIAVVLSLAQLLFKKLDSNRQDQIGKGVSVAHSVFNAIFDMGLVKNGTFIAAENEFWNQFKAKYLDAHDSKPSALSEAAAHKEFTALFTEST